MSTLIKDVEMPVSCAGCPCANDGSRYCHAAKEYIPMLGKPDFCPLAEVEERKRGEWIEDAETFYRAVNKKGGGVNENTPFFTEDHIACSECLTLFNVLENRTDIFSFCPNCGAYMRGEMDDNN